MRWTQLVNQRTTNKKCCILLFLVEKKDVKTDCEKLKDSSVYVKEWIDLQSAVKEESLTDWLLYDISKKIDGITYKAFSRHEEARTTGADWEWWFLFHTFSAKMRVQAKKLITDKDNYPSIAHTNKYGLQIENLLKDSQDKNFIPLYAFYTSLKEQVMCQRGITDEGVYMAGGNQVYTDFIECGKKHVHPSDVLIHCVPLSCFLCCPLCYEGDEGFIRFLSDYYQNEIKADKNVNSKNKSEKEEELPGIFRQIPKYVSSFIEFSREGLPEWWEKEFSYGLEGAKALVVYDARDRRPKKSLEKNL